LGQVRLLQRKYAEAESTLRDALTAYERVSHVTWERYNCQSLLGESLSRQKKFVEAEPLLLSGYEGVERREAMMPAAARSNIQKAADRIVNLYKDWGKPQQTVEWRQKIKSPPISPPNLP
jgi:hypothetical protein